MVRRLFGTDGIRGTANSEPMTAETALRVAMAAAVQFRRGDHRHLVVIGKDTRLSGYMLEPALTAGFIAMGLDVVLVGPLPTPAVAMLTRSLRADLGVVISASHNPFDDNGIKLFGPDGFKLSDPVEAAIEAYVDNGVEGYRVLPGELGRARRLDDAPGRYNEFVKSSFPRGLTLDGLKVAIDCANGAAYRVAPQVLWELGAEVVKVGTEPDGYNINKNCGALDTARLAEHLVAENADIGIALDGDADRVILLDEAGHVVDGDQLMALVAERALADRMLRGGQVVATVMSNLQLERHLGGFGIGLARTSVGDRYVVERMRETGCNVGGEPSGHIVLSDYTTTGDGLIAALQVLAMVQQEDRPASTVLRRFDPLPQLHRSIRIAGSDGLESQRVQDAIRDGRERLGDTGRLVIRKSGTEPLIRLMGEGQDPKILDSILGDIESAIREELIASS